MKVYIGGTMRGSAEDNSFVDQTYRTQIASVLRKHENTIEIFDPLGGCGVESSNKIDFERGKRVFFHEIQEVGSCDLLIAYLPQASMGTAIEMWEAFRWNVPIISISTMSENWAIKFLSDAIYSSMKDFRHAVTNGWIDTLLGV